QMADGIISIATVIMAGAIRKISVEHGLDPRDFILFSYGGGGPLHSCALAHEFGSGEVFFEHHAEMRYRGQRHNIKVPVSGLKDAEQIRAAFERDYKR